MSSRKRLFLLSALLLGGLLWLGSEVLADRVAGSMNPTRDPGPYSVDERAQALHDRAVVADLHADALLWNRDLLERDEAGHVDLPRLRDGNVAIQVFGVVTKVPKDTSYAGNAGDSDRLDALVIAQRWPPTTWTDLEARALHQARKLDRFVRGSEGGLAWIRDRGELEDVLARRAAGEGVVGVLLGLEGAHALADESDDPEAVLASLRKLHGAGLRMLGLAHFFDNAVAGSAHGLDKGGLGELGRKVVKEAEALGMVIDLAHAAPKVVDEVTSMTTRPVLVSHGGVRGTCDSPRNVSDAQLRAIAATGGVIGIGLWPGAVCGQDVGATVEAMLHVIGVVGVEHVALGSDFDGTITAPFDAAGWPLLTQALLRRGLSEEQVRAILGGNVVRVLTKTLPAAD